MKLCALVKQPLLEMQKQSSTVLTNPPYVHSHQQITYTVQLQ